MHFLTECCFKIYISGVDTVRSASVFFFFFLIGLSFNKDFLSHTQNHKQQKVKTKNKTKLTQHLHMPSRPQFFFWSTQNHIRKAILGHTNSQSDPYSAFSSTTGNTKQGKGLTATLPTPAYLFTPS